MGAPDSISGLAYWHKAEALALGDLASWLDETSANVDFAQATSARRPEVIAGAINSIRGVQFDVTNTEWMTAGNAAGFNALASGGYTLSWVIRTSSDSSSGFWTVFRKSAGGSSRVWFLINPNNKFCAWDHIVPDPLDTDTPYIITYTFSPTTTGHGDANLYVNGDLAATYSGAIPDFDTSYDLTLSDGSNPGGFTLCEQAGYDHVLSNGQRGSMEGGWSTKYDIDVTAPPGDPAVTPGVLSRSAVGLTTQTIDWTAAVAGAGGGSISYQLYRSTTPGFTPGGGNLIYGPSAAETFDDTGLTENTTYFYKLIASDGVNPDGESDQFAARTASSLDLRVVFIGDSTTLSDPGAGAPPTIFARLMAKTHPLRSVTVVNQGKSGSTTTLWLPTDTTSETSPGNILTNHYNTAKTAAEGAECNWAIIRLGINDALAEAKDAADFATDLDTLVAAVLTWNGGLDGVMVDYCQYSPTDAATDSLIPTYNAEIAGVVAANDGSYVGTTDSYEYFAANEAELADATGHFEDLGAESMAMMSVAALDGILNGAGTGGGGYPRSRLVNA